MLRLAVLVCAVHVAFAGFLNPASVTYVNGPAPAALRAGPAVYAAPPAAYSAPVYAQRPTFYSAPATYAAPVAPVAYHAPHVVKAVSTVQHVPAVADVPVQTYHHTPAVIQKEVDVHKPAIKTRKYEVRRPAIQKQFYDIEERVLIRPAGSALVELDEPVSRTQKGEAVITSAVHAVPVVPAFAQHFNLRYPVAANPIAAYPSYTNFFTQQQQQQQQQPAAQQPAVEQPAAPESDAPSAPAVEAPAEPQPSYDGSNSFSQQQQGVSNFAPQQDLESISVENPEFGARSAQPEEQPANTEAPVSSTTAAPATEATTAGISAEQYEAEIRAMFEARRAQFEEEQRIEAAHRAMLELQQNNLQRQQYEQAQAQARTAQASAEVNTEAAPTTPALTEAPTTAAPVTPAPTQAIPEASSEEPQLQARSFFGQQEEQIQQTQSLLQQQVVPEARSVVPSARNLSPEISRANQQRLIELLTARGGVAEVHGYGEAAGRTNGVVGDAGNLRARVISANAAENEKPTGERSSVRRIVVSRPIETVQEIEVAEPATKIQRITVQQPTYIKTAHIGVARVATSVPVYRKTLAAHPIAYY